MSARGLLFTDMKKRKRDSHYTPTCPLLHPIRGIVYVKCPLMEWMCFSCSPQNNLLTWN